MLLQIYYFENDLASIKWGVISNWCYYFSWRSTRLSNCQS